MKYYYTIKYRDHKGSAGGRSSTISADSIGDAMERVCAKAVMQTGGKPIYVTAIHLEELDDD